jgi:hypothetical protein
MIRFILGLVIVMGAVGGMEDPANSLLPLVAIAFVGLAIMSAGIIKLNKDNE